MKKKPFWQRVNRGVVVSLILLAAVAVYVLATQLMLLPAKREVRALGETVHKLYAQCVVMDDDALEALRTPAAQAEKREEIRRQLEDSFAADSDYLPAAADALMNDVLTQADGFERIRSFQLVRQKVRKCKVDDDVASLTVEYRYRVDGDFQYTGALQPVTGQMQELTVSLVARRQDGQWKIYRVSTVSRFPESW